MNKNSNLENNSASTNTNSVAIIGSGNVGATTAYALLQSGVVNDIILIDHDLEKAAGEAADLQHAVPLGPPVQVRAGDYRAAAQCQIVVMTAGAGGSPGESRLDLLDRNVTVVRECVRQLMAEDFQGVLVMTTNPVDVLARVAQQESGLPARRVISSGTVLDTARLRMMLADTLKVEAGSIDAYIIGEHGDSEIAVWSGARIAGVPLANFPGADKLPSHDEMLQRVRQAAAEVVERKGHTAFSIASCVRRICEAVLRDEHAVLAVSALMQGEYGVEGVYLGTPCIVSRAGIERVLQLPLNSEEQQGLHASADVLRRALDDAAKIQPKANQATST